MQLSFLLFSFCSPSVTASKFALAEVEKSSRKSEMAAVEKMLLAGPPKFKK